MFHLQKLRKKQGLVHISGKRKETTIKTTLHFKMVISFMLANSRCHLYCFMPSTNSNSTNMWLLHKEATYSGLTCFTNTKFTQLCIPNGHSTIIMKGEGLNDNIYTIIKTFSFVIHIETSPNNILHTNKIITL